MCLLCGLWLLCCLRLVGGASTCCLLFGCCDCDCGGWLWVIVCWYAVFVVTRLLDDLRCVRIVLRFLLVFGCGFRLSLPVDFGCFVCD